MTQERQSQTPMFSQIDVSQGGPGVPGPNDLDAKHVAFEQTQLLRDILSAQDRQNEVLEELVGQLGAAQRQRTAELGQWKRANPDLAVNCRLAAEALSKVQTEFLGSLTEEISENCDTLMDGGFMLNEFVDRFGPRLAHLNGVLQVLTQLSSASNPP